MEVDNSSPETSRRPSRSQQSLIVHLRLPPRLLALASSSDSLHVPTDKNPLSSPFPPSSPPTIASSPAPAAPPKKRGGPKRKPGPAPGASVFPVNDGNGGGSAAGTPGPTAEKERAKPGPKANPGGINAGLRALDRSGKPVRRWQKMPFPVQTVSGYSFYTKTWISAMPRDAGFEENTKTEGTESRWGGEGDKPLEQDSAMADGGVVMA